MSMFLTDPFEALFNLQRTLDAIRESDWLGSSPSSTGPFPALNIFRKGDDFVVLAELPGVKKEDLDIQVKNNAIRLAGKKSVAYSGQPSFHRRERTSGQFDRTITMPVEVDPEKVKAEYRDGILTLFLPRSERDKPKSIAIG